MQTPKTDDEFGRMSGNTSPIGDCTDLAKRALARLCAENSARAVSDVTKAALGNPMATALAYALCDADDDAAQAMIDDLLDAGLSVETVCLDHLAPAARRLGDWWDDDRLPFTEVTVATARIQSLMRRLPKSSDMCLAPGDKGAIFAAVPGELHILGVIMAADLFRRGGWDVSLMVGQTHDELIARLARDDRPVIGLSCSGDHSFAALKRLMRDLARVRPDAEIMISGRIVEHPERLNTVEQRHIVVRTTVEAEAQMQRLADDLDAIQADRTPHQARARA